MDVNAAPFLLVLHGGPGNPVGIVEAFGHRPLEVIEDAGNLLLAWRILRRPGDHRRAVAMHKG